MLLYSQVKGSGDKEKTRRMVLFWGIKSPGWSMLLDL
jgi:hypothetical protein